MEGPGENAFHLVNAFAGELQMVLGQVATEEKSTDDSPQVSPHNSILLTTEIPNF